MLTSINQKSLAIFAKLTAGLSEIGDSQRFGEFGDVFMPVCVEIIGRPDFGNLRGSVVIVSVAQYFKQMGDLMKDPEIVFLVGAGSVYPMVFEMSNPPVYQVTAEFREGKLAFNDVEQAKLALFANEWLSNISMQHEL